jgi:hypothetical protein
MYVVEVMPIHAVLRTIQKIYSRINSDSEQTKEAKTISDYEVMK